MDKPDEALKYVITKANGVTTIRRDSLRAALRSSRKKRASISFSPLPKEEAVTQ